MKVNLDKKMLDLITKKETALDIRGLVLRALNDAPTDKKKESDKADRWSIMKKIKDGGEVDLNKEEIAVILSCSSIMYKPAIWGFLSDSFKTA